MTQAKKSRHWWVVRDPVPNTHTIFLAKPAWNSIELGHERIHVVEHAAYEKAVAALVRITQIKSDNVQAVYAEETLRELGEIE